MILASLVCDSQDKNHEENAPKIRQSQERNKATHAPLWTRSYRGMKLSLPLDEGYSERSSSEDGPVT